jgi:transcription elongation GreA/GreB family factor
MATKKKTATSAGTAMATAPHPSTKERAIAALRASLAADLAALDAAARAAHDAATHPEAKPENDKDTRALEAGYLAGAQSARAAEVKRALTGIERAPTSAFTLLTVQEHSRGTDVRTTMLLAPAGGGQKVVVEDVVVAVVTPQSPLGAALVARGAGDVVEVEAGGRVRTLVVVASS